MAGEGARTFSEDLDQAEAFPDQHHLFAKSSEAAEADPTGVPPIGQTPIPSSVLMREGGVDFIEVAGTRSRSFR